MESQTTDYIGTSAYRLFDDDTMKCCNGYKRNSPDRIGYYPFKRKIRNF